MNCAGHKSAQARPQYFINVLVINVICHEVSVTESGSSSTSDHERGVLIIMTMNTNEEEPTWLITRLIINRQAARYSAQATRWIITVHLTARLAL